jgi:hypothetical protein
MVTCFVHCPFSYPSFSAHAETSPNLDAWDLLLTLHLGFSGGEEVMLDVGGQDATEAFEDVGHSDEARETLDQLLVGSLKRNVSIIPQTLHQYSCLPCLHPDGSVC